MVVVVVVVIVVVVGVEVVVVVVVVVVVLVVVVAVVAVFVVVVVVVVVVSCPEPLPAGVVGDGVRSLGAFNSRSSLGGERRSGVLRRSVPGSVGVTNVTVRRSGCESVDRSGVPGGVTMLPGTDIFKE